MDENTKNDFLALFLQTANDHILKMKSYLATFQSDVQSEEIYTEFHRHAHSLKGEARAMGYQSTADLSYLLELTFYNLKNGNLVLTPQLIVDISQCVDALEISLRQISSTQKEVDLNDIISRFQQQTGVRLPDENGR